MPRRAATPGRRTPRCRCGREGGVGRLIRIALVLTALLALRAAWAADGDRAGHDAAASGVETVQVAFATNRAVLAGEEDDPDRFGDESGPLTFGYCRVEFDPIGILKSASRHITLRFPTEIETIVALEQLEAERFWDGIRTVAAVPGNQVAFYIHGYKMDFDLACRRTALLQRELGPEFTLLLFAWPSQDSVALYTRDETLLKTSSADIRAVLSAAVEAVGEGRIDAVAHSLGTRGLVGALASMAPPAGPLVGELVLVAPDMDRFDFDDALPRLRRAASGITIYVSGYDAPLQVSEQVHGLPRLGQAGENLVLFDGVETIDISDVPRRDIYGHNYHYFNARIIGDLRDLLVDGTRASDRPGLVAKSAASGTYWTMSADIP